MGTSGSPTISMHCLLDSGRRFVVADSCLPLISVVHISSGSDLAFQPEQAAGQIYCGFRRAGTAPTGKDAA